MTFEKLYKKACSLDIESLCDFKDGKCHAERLGVDDCSYCPDYCEHFKGGKCCTKNILCKAYSCPTVDNQMSKDQIAKQEEVIKEALSLGYGKYGFRDTRRTNNPRIDKIVNNGSNDINNNHGRYNSDPELLSS